MSALDRFEQFVQGIVERPFSRLTGTRIQPVELAKRLDRELVSGKTIGVRRMYVPNDYTVSLASLDFAEVEPYKEALQKELERYVESRASERGAGFVGPVHVSILRDDEVSTGAIRVISSLRDGPADSTQSTSGASYGESSRADDLNDRLALARLTIQEEDGSSRVVMVAGPLVRLGRGLDNDVVLESLSVSRYHAQIADEGEHRFSLRDLGSTNGTAVNGQPATREELRYGDTFTLGAVDVHFQRPA